MKTGQRVVLIGNHPWAGHAGEYVRDELIETLGSTWPVVRLDSGQECFVMNSDQWQAIPEPPRKVIVGIPRRKLEKFRRES